MLWPTAQTTNSPLRAVEDAHLDVGFREHRVDEEAVAGQRLTRAADVGDDGIAIQEREWARM